MAKSALAVQEDQMSLRASVRGSSSLIDGHRLCLAVGLCEEQQVKNICAEEGLEYERTRVVTAGVVKANSSEVDTNPMTLIRRNAVLEVYEKKGINWEF
jgi:hypothetical protein